MRIQRLRKVVVSSVTGICIAEFVVISVALSHSSPEIHILHWSNSVPCDCIHSLLVSVYSVVTARSELRKVLFLVLSLTFLFVYKISREPLNGFAPNSQGRRGWSLARTSLNIKVKGQDH